jgi:hypothetical protein
MPAFQTQAKQFEKKKRLRKNSRLMHLARCARPLRVSGKHALLIVQALPDDEARSFGWSAMVKPCCAWRTRSLALAGSSKRSRALPRLHPNDIASNKLFFFGRFFRKSLERGLARFLDRPPVLSCAGPGAMLISGYFYRGHAIHWTNRHEFRSGSGFKHSFHPKKKKNT